MTQHTPISGVLYDLIEGLEDMRRRHVIDESDDDQFLDLKLTEARKALADGGWSVPDKPICQHRDTGRGVCADCGEALL